VQAKEAVALQFPKKVLKLWKRNRKIQFWKKVVGGFRQALMI